jgi:hypothetical protein
MNGDGFLGVKKLVSLYVTVKNCFIKKRQALVINEASFIKAHSSDHTIVNGGNNNQAAKNDEFVGIAVMIINHIENFKASIGLKLLVGERIKIEIIEKEDHQSKNTQAKKIQHRRFIKFLP